MLKQRLLVASIKERLGKLKHINVAFIGPHLSEVMQASGSARAKHRFEEQNQIVIHINILGLYRIVAYMFLK